MPKCVLLTAFATICAFAVLSGNSLADKPPNIIFILADDLGWGDVSYHGANQIPTPNIDALAATGVVMQQYYSMPICTPSRAAFLSGKEPYRIGFQHNVLQGSERRGLPLNLTLMPQYLKRLNYKTHIAGKWHLGHYKKEYTPTYRGFDSHLGPWTGHHDEFDHWAFEAPSSTISSDFEFSVIHSLKGLDFRRGMDVAKDLHGQYSTHLFTNESINIIENHDQSCPLFLFIAHTAVHSGNPYDQFAAPNPTVANYSYIQDWKRQRFAGMLAELDASVGRTITALKDAKMLENSIIVFASDNGAPLNGAPDENYGSNWPLKGNKYTLFEGGSRVPAIVWSKDIKNPGRISNNLMHVPDWLCTLWCAAGGKPEDLDQHDGYNQWEAITQDLPSPRNQLVYNIDGNTAAIRVGKWKIVQGLVFFGLLDPYSGTSAYTNVYPLYDVEKVLNSPVYKALSPITKTTGLKILLLRESARVRCNNELMSNSKRISTCNNMNGHVCLFDLENDPCEINDVSSQFPGVVKQLLEALAKANETYVPPSNLPNDPRADPKYWDYTWTNFGDYLSDLQ